jgi:hypothetical protein
MDRKLIPFLAFTLLPAASGGSPQPAPHQQAAPVHQPAIEQGNPCLPPAP